MIWPNFLEADHRMGMKKHCVKSLCVHSHGVFDAVVPFLQYPVLFAAYRPDHSSC